MAYRELFTDEEWRTLQLSILWVFYAIAEVDGLVDEKEWAALYHTFEDDSSVSGNPLMQELLRSIHQEGDQAVLAAFRQDRRGIPMGLRETAELAESKLEAEQARHFKLSLLFLGTMFARASGELPGQSSGPRVSEAERAAILTVAAIFRLKPEDLLV